MSNKLLEAVNEGLRRRGQKGIKATAQQATAQAVTPDQPALVGYLPPGLEVFARGLDQPETPALSEVEQAQKARLQQAAAGTMMNLTAKERYEAAHKRMVDAGMYR